MRRTSVITDRWPGRQVLIAQFIPAGSSVVDLGAGSGLLRSRLRRGCTYAGFDLPEFDMNRGRWPGGSFDIAVMAGVLEYARYPAAVLRHLAELAPKAIVTYSHGGRRDPSWANDLTPEMLVDFAGRAGFEAQRVASWRTPEIHPQAVWQLSR